MDGCAWDAAVRMSRMPDAPEDEAVQPQPVRNGAESVWATLGEMALE